MGGQRVTLSLAPPRWRRPQTCKIDQLLFSFVSVLCLWGGGGGELELEFATAVQTCFLHQGFYFFPVVKSLCVIVGGRVGEGGYCNFVRRGFQIQLKMLSNVCLAFSLETSYFFNQMTI